MRGFLPTGATHRATSLELLFDLVFVYAITAITDSVAAQPTVIGLAQGLVLMGLTWFGWSAYAWLGNQVRADEGALRIAMYLATAGYFVAALTLHEAFDGATTALPGPVVFVCAYAVIRLAHLVVYRAAAGEDLDLRRTIRSALASTVVVLVVLFVGAFLDPVLRLGVWAVAVAIDYIGIFVGAAHGWRVAAPGHFAERHAAVVIIAIGESVVSVAVAVSQTALTWPLLLAALLGITLAITLWRTYFSAIAIAAERALSEQTGDRRTRLARDTFTYLHPPLVIGIVGLAIGLQVMLEQVSEHGMGMTSHLPAVATGALFGGGAVYLATLAALRWRLGGTPSVPRLVVAGWLILSGTALSLGPSLPMLDVAVVTCSFLGLTAFDAVRYGRITRRLRLGEG